MIHFKVIRASRLLLALTILLLAAVLVFIGVRLLAQRDRVPVNGTASLVEAQEGDEAKAAQAFASSGNSGCSLTRQGEGIEIEVIGQNEVSAPAPRVLIYHTHTHEAYEQVPAIPMKPWKPGAPRIPHTAWSGWAKSWRPVEALWLRRDPRHNRP